VRRDHFQQHLLAKQTPQAVAADEHAETPVDLANVDVDVEALRASRHKLLLNRQRRRRGRRRLLQVLN
jgi:hypothetical protein